MIGKRNNATNPLCDYRSVELEADPTTRNTLRRGCFGLRRPLDQTTEPLSGFINALAGAKQAGSMHYYTSVFGWADF